MINLGRLSGAIVAAALPLWAFPGAISGQEKPPPVVTEQKLEKNRTDFDSSKIEQRLKDIEQRLDRIESLIRQQTPQSDGIRYAPGADGKPGDSDLGGCCRHINHVVVCSRYVDHYQPCCRHAYR
jgi:hypothetical protein